MKKPILIAVVLFLVVIALVYVLGFYPITRINGEVIWYGEFDDLVAALVRFDEKARVAAGDPVLTAEERADSGRLVLETMIGERILRQYALGRSDFSSVPAEAENLVRTALQNADIDTLPRATKELYGWGVDEFRENVLYPQAFQNVLMEKVEEDGVDFEQFITAQLAAAHVQTFFVPWEWRDGALYEKE